jgi:hypothetical protein
MLDNRKKVVSKAQYRFFRDAIRRIEAGGESMVKDMTLPELIYAIEDVDFDALPERSGKPARKPRRQALATPMPTPAPTPPPSGELPPWAEPIPEAPPEGVISIYSYRARHPEKMLPAVDQGEDAHILSFDGHLQRFPWKKRRVLPAAVGHEWFPMLFQGAK